MNKKLKIVDRVPLHVDRVIDSELINEANPTDLWSRDSYRYDYQVTGVSRSNAPDIVAFFKIEPNVDYFLVYAVYSTGDSFGTDEGCVIWIDIRKTRKESEELVKELYEQEKIYIKNIKNNLSIKDEFSIEYTLADGSKELIHAPWRGYFESLEEFKIVPVRLQS